MFIPMAIAATATTPRMENASRRTVSPRMLSVRLPLIDQHSVQEQEKADERGE
jgi:hypothetical protein